MTRGRRRGRIVVAAGASLLLAAVACTSEEPSAEPPAITSPSPDADSPASTADTTDAPTTSAPPMAKPLTIAVAGDIHFEGVLRGRLDEPSTALSPATEALAAADVAIVNLETSIGTGGRPAPDKRYTFRAPPSAFTALAEAGIDVATMANNHALDFGRAPLPGMFDAIDAAGTADPALTVIGIGQDADQAFRPARTEIETTTVATIGATVAGKDPTADPTGHWASTSDTAGTADAIDPTHLLEAVEAADRTADVVVVYMHWGVQGERCPNRPQRSLAKDLVAAGADIVAGSHTHTLQGDGQLGDGYVAYGLGNYVWYTPSTSATGVLTLTVQPPPSPQGRAKVVDASWQPARIRANGLPVPLAGSAAAEFETELTALRECAGF